MPTNFDPAVMSAIRDTPGISITAVVQGVISAPGRVNRYRAVMSGIRAGSIIRLRPNGPRGMSALYLPENLPLTAAGWLF